MICPECERDLIFINNRLVCPECGKAWNEILSEDTTCYDPKIAKTYNSIVAYEYGIIDDLLRERLRKERQLGHVRSAHPHPRPAHGGAAVL